MNTPSLRALRVASPTPCEGATPAARQSRLRGVSGICAAVALVATSVCAPVAWAQSSVPLSAAAIAATTAAVDSTPAVDLRLTYFNRAVGNDGVQRESRYTNLMYRRKGSVWTERELPAGLRESMAHDHSQAHGPHAGHAHDEAQGAPLRVSRAADGKERVEVVLNKTRRVIEVDRAHHGNVGYGGSWDAAYWLVTPASLARMEPVGKVKAGVQRYRARQAEQTTLVDWDVAGQYPRRIERTGAHGLSYDLVTAARLPGPLAAPWVASEKFDRGDYSDLLD